jgi:hypothetical protein
MAGTEAILETVKPIAGIATNIGVIVIVAVFVIGVFAAIMYYLWYQKRWKQFEARIWQQDAFGQIVEKRDDAGIFVDRVTKAKRFFVKHSKSSLSADEVPIVMLGSKKIVYIRQNGLKNFEYVKPTTLNDNPSLKIVTESDVNWAVLDYERQKNAFSKNQWLQYMPFIALGIVAIVIMIIFIYFFKQLDVLQSFGNSLVEAARILNPSVIQ